MAQVNDVRQRVSVAHLGILLGCLLAGGCGDPNSQTDHSEQPFVRVFYQGQPLGNVQVRLHQRRGGSVLADSISGQDGHAYFAKVPKPEPPKYFVTVESISEGDWILDASICRELSKNISLKPLQSLRGQRIEIPEGAIKPLTSSKRR